MPLRPQHFSVEKEFDNLSIPAAWNLLGNTDHLNCTIGLPDVAFGHILISDHDLYQEASAKALDMLTTRWREYPFEWIREQRYAVQRIFENGPFIRFYGGVELKPGKAGCMVRVFAEITSRHPLGALIALYVGRKGVRDTLRYCEAYLRLAASGVENPLPRSRSKTPVARENLGRRVQSLERLPIRPDLIPHLNRHLNEGTDEEVLRMRPFALAHVWGADPYEVLRLFLYATKVGILNLTWELMCPNCRVPKAEYETLADVSSQFHCDTCGVNYNANFDQYVELRFSVHPSIREAADRIYCIGGPHRAPHIFAQHYLEPGMKRAFSVLLGAEGMRFRVSRYNDVALLSPVLGQGKMETREGGEGEKTRKRENELFSNPQQSAYDSPLRLTYRDDGWHPQALVYAPGLAWIELKNESAKTIVAILEKVQWDADAVTAAQVTTLQEFRDLFGSEVLAPGQQVGVESLSILFTDLKGSTPLYESVGDAKAYGMVWKHFEFLIEMIQKNQGALVRTMGDAVMAAFHAPENAVSAAMEIQARVTEFNRENRIERPIIIKIGVHQGPAVVVNSNNLLDYFGRTVNIAARVQNESVGGDVVLTADLFSDPAIQDALKRFPFEVTPFRAILKGVEGEFTLCRLTLKPY
ncbi:adenylate/guanylate cyclase domain-containing protein [Candidatus Poribacteria bacterium]|nr:adenylate/guanylate cyclase domain-containing protein [Candidatus Poribacteria bacterium]